MSEAYFENFIGAIDTILICILKPTSQQSRDVSICEGKLKSHQKYKYRFNIQSREGGADMRLAETDRGRKRP